MKGFFKKIFLKKQQGRFLRRKNLREITNSAYFDFLNKKVFCILLIFYRFPLKKKVKLEELDYFNLTKCNKGQQSVIYEIIMLIFRLLFAAFSILVWTFAIIIIFSYFFLYVEYAEVIEFIEYDI